jgi:hypothetical protein
MQGPSNESAVIPPSKVRLSQAHITTCVESNKWQPWPSCTKAYSRTNILALMKEGKVETYHLQFFVGELVTVSMNPYLTLITLCLQIREIKKKKIY